MQYLDKDQENPIEIISGAFMFLRRSALDTSGLLDEDFFMYGEDIDLSYRLLKTGQKNYYIPTPILHYKGESTKKNSYRYVHTFYKAMLIFFRKHYKHLGLFYAIPIQSAIYVKGVMTYLNLKLNRSKKDTKGDLDYMKERSFAFCGSENEYQQLMSAMSRFSIYVNHITVTDKYEWMSLLKTKRFDYIIFNAEDISYADMLEQLQSTSTSPYAPSLATFYPSSRIVITDSYTFEFA
ncbi:MAG: glycosyltransferase family 2 protein, partial [Bacteroidaceae bacterium]|nr:glycosyltransferase family 2 protein [Bacteroidaceae bacterium]